MFLKLKCKLFECYDIDGEVQHTFKNKISRLKNGNFCIPIISSKYNDGSFTKLAFTKTDIEIPEEIQHLISIQNWNERITKEYFVDDENYSFDHKQIELYIFVTRKDYLNSEVKAEYFCILEDYILDALTFPKEKNLFLDYGVFGNIDWSLCNTDKITCDKTNNLLIFYGTGKDYDQIYMDVLPEDLKKEIDKIKEKLCNLGIEKEIVDKSSSDYEINFQKIKAEMMFTRIKNECR